MKVSPKGLVSLQYITSDKGCAARTGPSIARESETNLMKERKMICVNTEMSTVIALTSAITVNAGR